MGYRGRHKARSRFHFLFVILCCLALLMLAYPFLEPFLLETESVTLTSADLPEDVASSFVRLSEPWVYITSTPAPVPVFRRHNKLS